MDVTTRARRAAAALVGLALAFGATGAQARRPQAPAQAEATVSDDDYFAVRTARIVSTAEAGGPWEIAVLGDSLTEKAQLPRVCGRSTLNGGLSGAGLADLTQYAPQILAAARPKVVVLAIGVNDAGRDDDRDVSEFTDPYAELIDLAQKSGARVYLGTIAPVARRGPTAAWYDPTLIAGFNRGIRKLARERGLGVVDFHGALAGKSGALPAAYTTPADGVHLTAAGYVRWFKALETVCGDLPEQR